MNILHRYIKQGEHRPTGSYLLMVAVGLLMLSLGSCSQQNLNDEAPTQGKVLDIRVSDGGYKRSASTQQRGLGSTEEGFKTVFTDGDAIGIYAVDADGKAIPDIQNMKLTLKSNHESLSWQTDKGVLLLKYPNASYYAYYPYSEHPTFTPAPSPNADATAFFADLIRNWNPPTDQGDHTKYTKQDLMVTQTKVGEGNTLTLDMKHQMELIVIEMPDAAYHFSNTDPKIDDYVVKAATPNFTGFTPYQMPDGSYRYLVSPKTNDLSLQGTYLMGGKKHSWMVPNQKGDSFTPAAGRYDFFQIDGGIQTINYGELSTGDFLLKDGNLLNRKTKLTDIQKNLVVGIVLKGGRVVAGSQYVDTCNYKYKDGSTPMSTIHGYAFALFNVDNYTHIKLTWFYDTGDIKCNTSRSATDFMGYSNTQNIKLVGGKKLEDHFPACFWASYGYEHGYSYNPGDHTAPYNSSGWFLPSEGQLTYAYGTANDPDHHERKDIITQSLNAVGGDSWIDGNIETWFWSSSEYPDGDDVAYKQDFVAGSLDNDQKSEVCSVRSILAF